MAFTHQFSSRVEPVSNISPTTFNKIRDCALKALWSLSKKPPLLPQYPKAKLGIIVHKLLSESGRGQLLPDRSAISARWNQLVKEIQDEMRASSFERHLVPLRKSVPDIEVRRIRTIQKVLEIANARWAAEPRDESHRAVSRSGHEIRVQSNDGLIRGTIDAVIRTSVGSIIRDYKSGPVLEPDGHNEYQPKGVYQTQLKLYAALYAESCGEWPTSLELVPLSGTTHEVAFDRKECSDLLDEARDALQNLNSKVSENPSESLPSLLANPSPAACTFCQYRPACKPYLVATAEIKDGEWPLDVVGIVKNVRQLGNGKSMLQLSTPGGTVNVPGLSAGNRHPILPEVRTGSKIGVFNLRRSRPSAPYSESQLTTLHTLS